MPGAEAGRTVNDKLREEREGLQEEITKTWVEKEKIKEDIDGEMKEKIQKSLKAAEETVKKGLSELKEKEKLKNERQRRRQEDTALNAVSDNTFFFGKDA